MSFESGSRRLLRFVGKSLILELQFRM